MSHRFIKTALPVFAILALSACENMYMRPLALPTGYTYLNDEYKSPPSPNATDIGYEYSAEKNAHIVASMKDKAAEMFGQIEAGSNMAGKKIYVYNARFHDAQNAAFDHVLREVISENGYTLAKSAHETGSYNLGYAIREPEDLDSEIDFGDFNDEYRVPFFNKYDEYENMYIDMALMDGQTVLTKVRAAYDLPMYGYKRHGEFYFLKPQLGAKSDDSIVPPAMPPMESQGDVVNTSAAPVVLHAPDQGYND